MGILVAFEGDHSSDERLRKTLRPLAAFSSFLLTKTGTAQRVSLIVPLAPESLWAFGLTIFNGQYIHAEMLAITEVWTRYSIAIPATLLAAPFVLCCTIPNG
ncbi:MAG: hypothetical protein ACOYZ6_09290 [Chloroflexota bacterium]